MMQIQKKRPGDKDPPGIGKKDIPKYILKLFVSGILENSVRAIKNINEICEQHLKGNYKLEIIDIYQQPDLAIGEQIIVIPVMIIKYPLPERRIIGDLSDVKKVLEILNCK
jgi:circadian clock protein KaiB